MGKRKRNAIPMMLLWDRRQQQRFVEAVERLNSLVLDLRILVDTKKRRSAAAVKANETRKNGEDALARTAAATNFNKGGEQ